VLGAFEVDETGSLASWMIPGKLVKGMGGAMDLVSSGTYTIVAMSHTNPAGESKLLKQCTLPLTGVQCIHRIVTDLAVLDIKDRAFHLIERAPGVSIEEIKSKTAGKLIIPEKVPEIVL